MVFQESGTVEFQDDGTVIGLDNPDETALLHL